MDKDIIHIIGRSRLWQGIEEKEISKILLSPFISKIKFQKGERIFDEGDIPEKFYILISGKIAISHDTVGGNRLLMATVENSGEMFGEIFAFMELPFYEMYTEALEETELLCIHRELFQSIGSKIDATIVEKLRMNLLSIFAEKTYILNRRIRILGCGSIREKIAHFILQNQGNLDHIVMMSRENMADYLGITRPSLSRELSQMTKEGIIAINKRKLKVIDQKKLEEYL